MGQPVAYLRKSKVDRKNPGTFSHEDQIRAVLDKAGSDADRLLILDNDWGVSGSGSGVGRKGRDYARLKAMIEAGEVEYVVSLNLARLGRNLMEIRGLVDLCTKHGVPIRLADGTNIDNTTATGTMQLNFLAAVAEFQSALTSESSLRVAAMRRARGDRLGAAPYGVNCDPATCTIRHADGHIQGESVQTLVDAYVEAGSFNGAVHLLNARGVRARGRGIWQVRTLERILRRERPDVVPATVRRGSPSLRAKHALSGLVVCWCGKIMTTLPRRINHVSYLCRDGHQDPRHGRPYVVSDRKLIPFVSDEVYRALGELRWEYVRTSDAAERADLDERRQRITDAYFDLRFDKTELDRRLKEIDARIAGLGQADRAIATILKKPVVDWSAPGPEINASLRDLIGAIHVDREMKPVSIDWLVLMVTASDRAG